jgi:hypothetical protein
MSFSTPSVSQFDPRAVPYQYRVLRGVRRGYDYSLGVHEVLLSGSVGSAKSILIAHIAVTHCLANERARFCYGRKAMPDLKDTILAKTLEHMEGDLVEGVDYEHNETKGMIEFSNGSRIISRSWSDKKYKKFRSIELSGAAIEELTENNEQDKQAYLELKMRVGRLPHITENIMVSATNPDGPEHWAYKYFIQDQSPTRHVYYSVTTDNPFLPPQYIRQLIEDLPFKLAERMIRGKWVAISTDYIYFEYDSSTHLVQEDYKVNPRFPVHIAYDFNIGAGKPMSVVLFQHVDGIFHFFHEVIIQGSRTLDTLEEMAGRGIFEIDTPKFIINGDASGTSKDTRSLKSDYEIIDKFIANFQNSKGKKIVHERKVPLANPPVRTRHNQVNAVMKNGLGEVRLKVYRACKTLDEGFRLTALKNGADYIEDDSKPYQHCTTAAGYGIVQTLKDQKQGENRMQSFSASHLRSFK